MDDLPMSRRCRRVTRCSNGAAHGRVRNELLRLPTLADLAPGSSLQGALAAFEAGRVHTDATGRCLWGHTDVAHANETERVKFFEMTSSAGRCGHCVGSGGVLGAETFACACVSLDKVANALAVEWHHEYHHQVLGGSMVAVTSLVVAVFALTAARRFPAAAATMGVVLAWCLLFALCGVALAVGGAVLRSQLTGAWWWSGAAAAAGELGGGSDRASRGSHDDDGAWAAVVALPHAPAGLLPPSGFYWRGCGEDGGGGSAASLWVLLGVVVGSGAVCWFARRTRPSSIVLS